MHNKNKNYNLAIKRLHPKYLDIHSFKTDIIFPTIIDLRPKMPPIYNQFQIGSCTANALAALL